MANSKENKEFIMKAPFEGTFVLEGFEEKMGRQTAKLRCVDEGTDIGFVFVPASVVLDLEDSKEKE